MRWFIIAATLALLVACGNRVVTSSPTSILVEGNEFARDGRAIAEAHCAQFGKRPRLKVVEPMTHVSWINHYDCI
jgi:hypothetical protein